MTRRAQLAAVVGAGVAALATLDAQILAPSRPADPRGYVAFRAASPINVDGRLDDGAWRDAPWTDDFVDIEGDAKPKPALPTHAKMVWDDTYFYIGAELREPSLRATLTAHDSVIFHDNDFEVFIDPNGDSHEYYEFEINALATYWDLLLPRPYKDGGKPVNNWEIPGMKAAVHLDGTLNDARDVDRAWSVELAFPWRALGELARRPAPPKDGDEWRVNFSRVEWLGEPKEHNWVWSPQYVIDMHRPEMWGYVQFSNGRPGQVPFVPDPALPARRWLHELYYAQRAYRQAHARWAGSLEDLRIGVPTDTRLGAAELRVAGSLFEASIDLRLPGQPPQHWHIRHDALIWRDE